MLHDKHKNKLYAIEVTVVVLLILALPLLFFKPSITGFVASNTFAQPIDIALSESQMIMLKSSAQIKLSSFLVSGEIIGDGAVAVYLSNSAGKDVLVYTNTIMDERRSNLITGFSIGAAHAQEAPDEVIVLDIEPGQKLPWDGSLGSAANSDPFTNVCIDSCFLNSDEFAGTEFGLKAYVEPGTTLMITEIFFTLE
jgi:hypothetical protein